MRFVSIFTSCLPAFGGNDAVLNIKMTAFLVQNDCVFGEMTAFLLQNDCDFRPHWLAKTSLTPGPTSRVSQRGPPLSQQELVFP